MRIAVTRPVEDAGPLKVKLEALGHEVLAAPLMTIRPRDNAVIADLPYQAIAVTSANGVRALPHPERFRSIRTLTVGPQSLAAATALGFKAEAHGGDVDGLAAFIRDELDPKTGPILYLSGSETAGDLESQLKASGFDCRRVVLYDAVPMASLGSVEASLREDRLDAVLLYSPRTARIWRDLVMAGRLEQRAAAVRHLCLSRNVAAVLPEDWNVAVAASPEEGAILALLDQFR